MSHQFSIQGSRKRSSIFRRHGWVRSVAIALLLIAGAGRFSCLLAGESELAVSRVTIRLVREASISAKDSGTIAEFHVREGESIGQHELVAVLDNEQHLLNVRAAELNLHVAELRAADESAVDSAMAQLQEAKSGRRLKEIALQIAEKEAATDVPVQIASADTRLKQLELDRAEGARESFRGSVSESQIDRLRTSVEKGQLEIQQARLDDTIQKMKPDAERAALEQKGDEIRRFEALVSQGRREQIIASVNQKVKANEVAQAQVGVERRNARAPFSGVVVELKSAPGEWIEQGKPIARIIDLKTLRAEGFLPVQKASLKLRGRGATIQVGGEKLRGTVTFVSPEVDPVNQQVRIWVQFKNVNSAVLPGMNGSLSIDAE